MANEEYLALLRQGVAAWNAWRKREPEVRPDLTEAHLGEVHLAGAALTGALLRGADLGDAHLAGASLARAHLDGAVLRRADLAEAHLTEAHLARADLAGANLRGALLHGANLTRTDLVGADLTGADLSYAQLVRARLERAKLTGARIYGVSVWDLQVDDATEWTDLIITPKFEPAITVDNLNVAQFVYLLLNNQEIRQVIDAVGKKGVLILGRFTPERKAVLDTLQLALRRLNYVQWKPPQQRGRSAHRPPM
jgi:hypothetical protein